MASAPEMVPSTAIHSPMGNGGDGIESAGGRRRKVSKMEWVAVSILFYVHLINCMNRFTFQGVLEEVISFGIDSSQRGLFEAVTVISCIIFAPSFGYVGDRYPKKWILTFGVLLWSITTFAGSLMKNHAQWFVAFRAVATIGELSFELIWPTIIGDLFNGDVRSRMLALFYFFIPIGRGLGYIAGAQAAKLGGAWYWSLRITPFFGAVAVILTPFLVVSTHDPSKGERKYQGVTTLTTTSWTEDLRYLVKNKSFMLSSAGLTCVTVATTALTWLGPKYISYGLNPEGDIRNQLNVSFLFGVVTLISWLVGVPLGNIASTNLRAKNFRADPLICAIGLLISPLMFAVASFATNNVTLYLTLIFFGQVFININWSIVADILLYVIIPSRRCTAVALQIVLSNALKDTGPYVIGLLISEGKSGADNNAKSLQNALILPVFVLIVGGVFFLITAKFIIQDKQDCDEIVAASSSGEPVEPKTTSNPISGSVETGL